MPAWCRELPAAELAVSALELRERAPGELLAAQVERERVRLDWCNLRWALARQLLRTILQSSARLALNTKPHLWPTNRSTACRRCNRIPDRQPSPTRRLFRPEPVLPSNSTIAVRPPTARSSICPLS